jgi:outer membrane murein-binding lipoprotein Lpp
MLDLYEFRRAGRSRKATSWITDPARFLLCSFLWPYFKRVLTEIEEQPQMNARQARLESRVDDLHKACNAAVARQTHLESRVDDLHKACNAAVARQTHIESRVDNASYFTTKTAPGMYLYNPRA